MGTALLKPNSPSFSKCTLNLMTSSWVLQGPQLLSARWASIPVYTTQAPAQSISVTKIASLPSAPSIPLSHSEEGQFSLGLVPQVRRATPIPLPCVFMPRLGLGDHCPSLLHGSPKPCSRDLSYHSVSVLLRPPLSTGFPRGQYFIFFPSHMPALYGLGWFCFLQD